MATKVSRYGTRHLGKLGEILIAYFVGRNLITEH